MGLILLTFFVFSMPGRAAFPRPAIPSGRAAAPRPLDGRYALWDGQTAPVALPEDQALRYSPSLPPAAPNLTPNGRGDGSLPRSADGAPGELFVSIEVGPNDQLKDAVADLAQTAGFHADARFAPIQAARGDGLKVFGWMPAARLGEAARVKSLRSLEIERSALRPASGAAAQIEVLVGVRRAAGLSQAEDDARFSQTMRELADEAQFQWERTAGYQAIPGSPDAAILVVGKLPARRLPRMMANSGVVKIQPFPGLPAPASAAAPSRNRCRRFLAYVAVQSPLLLAATGLLLLPPLRPRLKRGARR